MLCGHVNGEGSREDVFNGNTVRTLVADYQFRGGAATAFCGSCAFPRPGIRAGFHLLAWIRQYETDADSQFQFSYPMPSSPVAFAPSPPTRWLPAARPVASGPGCRPAPLTSGMSPSATAAKPTPDGLALCRRPVNPPGPTWRPSSTTSRTKLSSSTPPSPSRSRLMTGHGPTNLTVNVYSSHPRSCRRGYCGERDGRRPGAPVDPGI